MTFSGLLNQHLRRLVCRPVRACLAFSCTANTQIRSCGRDWRMVLRQQEWLRERSLKSVVSLTGKQPVKVAGDGCCMGGLDRLRYKACSNVHHCVCYTDTGQIICLILSIIFSFFFFFKWCCWVEFCCCCCCVPKSGGVGWGVFWSL